MYSNFNTLSIDPGYICNYGSMNNLQMYYQSKQQKTTLTCQRSDKTVGGCQGSIGQLKQGVKLLFKFLSLIKGKNHTVCTRLPRQHYNHDVVILYSPRGTCVKF